MNEKEQDLVSENNTDTTTKTEEAAAVSNESKVEEVTEVKTETSVTAEEVTPVTSSDSVVAEVSETPVAVHPAKFNIKIYVATVLAILAIGTVLVFALEKQGRISTGIFTTIIEKMEAKKPVAKVNDVTIVKKDLDSSVEQLIDIQKTQGVDVSDPTILEQVEQQAMDTLVNAELLRQAAVTEGITVTKEEIDDRYSQISEGLGGAEALAERMAEFKVTEESLRRDIENEFLINGLFKIKIPKDDIKVTDEEVIALYEQVKKTAADLPPLADVKEQIVKQISLNKEQEMIAKYLESLKSEAEIEILI